MLSSKFTLNEIKYIFINLVQLCLNLHKVKDRLFYMLPRFKGNDNDPISQSFAFCVSLPMLI